MISETPHRSRESTDTRRKAIAMAVRQLIVEKGFENLRTREIAERVGINVATLHYHVPSKEALVELVARSIKEEFMARHRDAAVEGMSPRARFEHELEVSRGTQVERPDQAVVLMEFGALAARDPRIAAVIDPMQDYRRRNYTEMLAAGRADGSFRPDIDPDATARMLVAALNGFGLQPVAERTPANFDRLAAELRRAILNPSTDFQKSP